MRGLTLRRFPDLSQLPVGGELRIVSARAVERNGSNDLVPGDYTELWW
jgi:hypothetical protein